MTIAKKSSQYDDKWQKLFGYFFYWKFKISLPMLNERKAKGTDILYFWTCPWDSKFFLWHFFHIYLEHDKYIYLSNYINTRSLFYLSSGALCYYVGGKADSFLLLPRDE